MAAVMAVIMSHPADRRSVARHPGPHRQRLTGRQGGSYTSPPAAPAMPGRAVCWPPGRHASIDDAADWSACPGLWRS